VPEEKKLLVGVAVEREWPERFRRCRMAMGKEGCAELVHALAGRSADAGGVLKSEGWLI